MTQDPRIPLLRRAVPILSPLRYPGAKRRHAAYIAELIRLNDLKPNVFIEPMAGGASVSLQLLADKTVQRVVLGDIDPWVSAFWKVVLDGDHQWLIEQLKEIEISVRQWDLFRRSTPTSQRDMALTCIYLNRSSYGGILHPSVGVMGGLAQSGKQKVDSRFKPTRLISRIQQAAVLGDKVEVVHGTWLETAKVAFNLAPSAEQIMMYLDPPYGTTGRRLYRYDFSQEEHRELRRWLASAPAPWVLSGSASDPGVPGSMQQQVQTFYTGKAVRHSATEILWTNLKKVPEATKLWRSGLEWNPRHDQERLRAYNASQK